MDKEPKRSGDQQDEDQTSLTVTNIPLTIVVSALINTKDWFDWIVRAAEALVVFVLTYNILGKTLFVALVVTPLLVGFIESCFDCWTVISLDNWDDDDDMGGNDREDDDHFNDHWNNLIH